MDEASFLGSGDDLDFDVGLVAGTVQEVSIVFGFSHRTGGYRVHFGIVSVGQPSEVLERCDRAVDGTWIETLHVLGARAQPHRYLVPSEDLWSTS